MKSKDSRGMAINSQNNVIFSFVSYFTVAALADPSGQEISVAEVVVRAEVLRRQGGATVYPKGESVHVHCSASRRTAETIIAQGSVS